MKKKSSANEKGRPVPKPGNSVRGRTEEDKDDLIHSGEEDRLTELGSEDPDDAVHRPPKHKPTGNERMEDPDDLVHGYDEDDDEK